MHAPPAPRLESPAGRSAGGCPPHPCIWGMCTSRFHLARSKQLGDSRNSSLRLMRPPSDHLVVSLRWQQQQQQAGGGGAAGV
jgi:hypothetical protein